MLGTTPEMSSRMGADQTLGGGKLLLNNLINFKINSYLMQQIIKAQRTIKSIMLEYSM
jgi:hypothetical protein